MSAICLTKVSTLCLTINSAQSLCLDCRVQNVTVARNISMLTLGFVTALHATFLINMKKLHNKSVHNFEDPYKSHIMLSHNAKILCTD